MKRIASFLIIIFTIGCFTTSCITPKLPEINALYSAIVSDNLERVKEAVENGADVNKKSIFYLLHEVPILYSIQNGQDFIPEYLLLKGADPNYIDEKNGMSLLMYAVGARPEGGITYLNATDNDVYKVLLKDTRIDVNLKGKLGFTALDYVCRDKGSLEIVNYLIEHGAKITPVTMKCAIEGYKSRSCEESVLKLIYDDLKKQKIFIDIEPEIEAILEGNSERLIDLVSKEEVETENKQILMLLTCA